MNQGLLIRRICTLLLCGALGLLPRAYAQEVTAGIYGSVQDASAAVIPKATVTLHNVDTGRDYPTVCDDSGNFTLTLIPIGNYVVQTSATGFKTSTVTGISLAVNDKRHLLITLEVGQVTDSVSVSADTVTVDTASGTTSAIVNNRTILNLPSQARAIAPFALQMPGAVSSAPNSPTANYTSVNGVRPTHNAWLLDGGYDIDTGGNWNITLAPNMEIVDEVRAIRGNYSAEFGIGGGSQFNVITKSGTNSLHGSAYEFLQNNAMNARSYFQPTVPSSKINEFGFTVGGPAYIPKIYNGKNKTFFFVNVDWNKQRTATSFLQKVPEVAYRNGDFSSLGKTITDPLTGAAFAGNIIPASRIDPIAAKYASLYPTPNYSNSIGQNWAKTQPGRLDHRQYTLKGDHYFSEKHRLSARWTADHADNDYGAAAGFDSLREDDISIASNLTIDFTSTLTPNLINDFNFVRVGNRLEDFPEGPSSAATGISIPKIYPLNDSTYPLANLNLSAIPDRIPTISLTNYAGITPSSPWSNFQHIYDIKDNVTWTHGSHTLKFGFDVPLEQKFEPTNTNVFGAFTFDGKVTGDAFADMLLGRAAEYDEVGTVPFNNNLRNSFEAYVDDSYKVTRRLVIDIGVRYSFFPPAHEQDDKYRVFLPSAYDPSKAVTIAANGTIVPGSGDTQNGLVNPADYWKYSKSNFAPRFSFAYDLMGDGKTSIRGGYGIFYSREILGAFILMSGNPPYGQSTSLYNTTLDNPAAGTTGASSPLTLGSNDINQHTPYTEQYNFNIQRALGKDWLLEVGYAGSHGVHMMRTQDVNQPAPSVAIANKTVNANTLRPYLGYGVISNREQSYASKYNGLQVSLNHRFASGFMIKANYTWSKSLDNTDCCSGNIYNYYPDSQNASMEWGRSSFDAEHNFLITYVYELPYKRGAKGAMGLLFGGWQLSGITTLQTGLPVDVALGVDQAGVGNAARQRPQVIGDPVLDHGSRSVSEWFDPTQFTYPTIGTFATTSRNFISKPGTANWDMSLYKTFSLAEKSTLQLRGDAFNVWNHTEFDTLGLTLTTPSQFGKVITAKNPRSMMIGLRLQF